MHLSSIPSIVKLKINTLKFMLVNSGMKMSFIVTNIAKSFKTLPTENHNVSESHHPILSLTIVKKKKKKKPPVFSFPKYVGFLCGFGTNIMGINLYFLFALSHIIFCYSFWPGFIVVGFGILLPNITMTARC